MNLQSPRDWLELLSRYERQLALAATAVIVALLGLSIARTLIFVLGALAPPALDAGAGAGHLGREGSAAARASLPSLASMELFGELQEAAPSQAAPQTSLNLELQGVFIAPDTGQSTAIIGRKNEAGEVYRVGDRLPGNSTLSAVYSDHVLIRHGQRVERLPFADSAFRLPAGGAAPAPAAAGAGAGQAGALPRRQASAPGSSARQVFQAYSQRLQEDPAGLLAELGLRAVSPTEARGYHLGAAATQPLLQQAGLQPGDVILSVNGVALGQALQDSALIQQVLDAGLVRVEVQRGERRFFLTAPIPQ